MQMLNGNYINVIAWRRVELPTNIVHIKQPCMLNEEIDEAAVVHQTKIHGTHRETKTALHWNAKNPIARENDCCAYLFSSPPCTKSVQYNMCVHSVWRRLWTRTLANISETKNNLLLVLLFWNIHMYMLLCLLCYSLWLLKHAWAAASNTTCLESS